MSLRSNSLVVLLFGLMSVSAMGQIRVVVECDNYKFIVGEAIMAKVTVYNDVEVPLVFSKSYHNAEFELCAIRDRASARIPTIKNPGRDIVIMPSESESEIVDLSYLMNLNEEGSYQVYARVRHDGLLFTSQSKGLDIVRGIELASVKRSLSGYSKNILTYSLRYIDRNRTECAFLIVSDEKSGVSYGTVRLGSIVRVTEPSMKFNDKGQIIIVHQSGRKRFTRSVIKVHRGGSEFIKQTHHKKDGSRFGN